MGGIGSGECDNRWIKKTVDQLKTIDVREWRRQGLLEPNLLLIDGVEVQKIPTLQAFSGRMSP